MDTADKALIQALTTEKVVERDGTWAPLSIAEARHVVRLAAEVRATSSDRLLCGCDVEQGRHTCLDAAELNDEIDDDLRAAVEPTCVARSRRHGVGQRSPDRGGGGRLGGAARTAGRVGAAAPVHR